MDIPRHARSKQRWMTRDSHGGAVIQIDCSGLIDRAREDRHLFSNLIPTHKDEKELLIHKDHRPPTWEERVLRTVWTLSAVVCAIGLIVTVVAATTLLYRINSTISSVDNAVSLHRSASSMITNLDNLLNTSTHIADTIHELGIKGLDASVFSRPYLTQMLNSTTDLLQDVHRVAENPSIKIGG